MRRVAGIDGGQTSTVAVVVDETGAVLGRGSAGPSDHVGQAADSDRAARACIRALTGALAAAGLAADAPLEAVAIGLSGYEGSWHGAEPAFVTSNVLYVHDSVAALAGAIAGRPAGVVIAGTGSAGYAEGAKGETVRAGGYGYVFGDGGSAFAIARTALAEAMEAADRGVRTDLGDAALPYFDVRDLRTLARDFSLNRIGRPHVAGFSRVVLDAARFNDPAASAIVEDAAASLGRLARALGDQVALPGEKMPVAFVGGVAEHPIVMAAIRAGLARAARLTVVEPAHDQAVGAALLAFDRAGIPRPAIAPA